MSTSSSTSSKSYCAKTVTAAGDTAAQQRGQQQAAVCNSWFTFRGRLLSRLSNRLASVNTNSDDDHLLLVFCLSGGCNSHGVPRQASWTYKDMAWASNSTQRVSIGRCNQGMWLASLVVDLFWLSCCLKDVR